jgi:hypothetical protein
LVFVNLGRGLVGSSVKKNPIGDRKVAGKPAFMMVHYNWSVFRLLLLLMLLSNLTPVVPPITGEIVVSGDRLEREDNLQAEADALLLLFDDMPSVAVYLKDEPILRSGTNTRRGVAYTHCQGNELPSIFVKKFFIKKTTGNNLLTS